MVQFALLFFSFTTFFIIFKRFDLSKVCVSLNKFCINREIFVTHDLNKQLLLLNFVRIIAGAIFLDRSFNIARVVYFMDPLETKILTTIDVLASVGVLLGVLTPIFTGILFFLHTHYIDVELGTYTLGSDMHQLLLLIFFFAPVGTRLSLDNFLSKKFSFYGNSVVHLYKLVGFPTQARLAVVKLAAFTSYGLLCVWSVHAHFLDPFWLNGTANVLTLTSSWMTGPYQIFRNLFSAGQEVAIVVSALSNYSIMFWELFLLPLVYFKGPSRWFGIWFALAFFLVSMFILQLGKLSHYEFALWAILFWPGWLLNLNGQQRIEVFYDDRCNVCDKTIVFLNAVDIFSICDFKPITKNAKLADKRGFSGDEILMDLCGYSPRNGKSFRGYELYFEISRRVLFLLPFSFILLIGKFLDVGPKIYGFIAKNRIKIAGICEIPSLNFEKPKAIELLSAKNKFLEPNSFFSAFVATYLVLTPGYLLRMPWVDHIPLINKVQPLFNSFNPYMWSMIGQIPIVVFTPDVIYMGSHFYTVTANYSDGTSIFLPYVGEDGERLDWVLNSDRIYFGHALTYRRRNYGRWHEDLCYEPNRDNDLHASLFKYADHLYGRDATSYTVRYFRQPIASPSDAADFRYSHDDRRFVCVIKFKREKNGWSARDDAGTDHTFPFF